MFRILFLALFLQHFTGNAQDRIFTNLKDIEDPLEVTHLELRRNKLKKFPVEILSFKNLVYLDLSKNKIQEIPNEISTLKKLNILVLSKNQISDIESLTVLENLEELHLDRNPIKNIPSEISNLKKLLVFDCWQCQIDNLPSQMKDLNKLIEIDLRQTFIKQQDAGIYNEWWPNAKIMTTWGCNCGK